MLTLIPATIALLVLNNASAGPSAARVPQQIAAPSESSSATLSSLLGAVESNGRGNDAWSQASQTVFVLPGPDFPPESFVVVSEDMFVMCRILDKALAPVAMRAPSARFDPFGRTFSGGLQTQGLYLDGYGALFFVQVGFPLVPPPSEPNQAKAEEPADPTWSQTVDELNGVSPNQGRPAAPQYNAQKVESLKSILVKSLRHAANLRLPGVRDYLTVIVTARGTGGSAFAYSTTQPPQNRAWTEPVVPASEDALVLRTTKADVDAFAKGDLDAEQFSQKVQILRSWTSTAGQPTVRTGGVVPSTGTSPYGRRR